MLRIKQQDIILVVVVDGDFVLPIVLVHHEHGPLFTVTSMDQNTENPNKNTASEQIKKKL